MDLWVIFAIVGLLLAAGEVATTSFYLAPFAGGALLAAAVDGAGGPPAASITTFILASILLFVLVRPIAQRHRNMPPLARTGMDALIGQRVLVLDAVDGDAGTVKLSGEVWSARTTVEGAVIPAGTRVQVIAIQGATAIVAEPS